MNNEVIKFYTAWFLFFSLGFAVLALALICNQLIVDVLMHLFLMMFAGVFALIGFAAFMIETDFDIEEYLNKKASK